MAEDPLEEIRTLGTRASEVLSVLGMDILNFAVIPSIHRGQPDTVQIFCSVDPERAFLTPEQRAMKEALDGMLTATAREERVNRKQATIERLKRQIATGEYFEDPPEEAKPDEL